MLRSMRCLILPLMLALAAPPAARAQSAFFSGGASMRIEVEVYKGPLAKDIRSQIAEFHGLLDQTQIQFQRIGGQIDFWRDTVSPDCKTAEGKKKLGLIPAYMCTLADRLGAEAHDLNTEAADLSKGLQDVIQRLNTRSFITATDGSEGTAIATSLRNVATHATAFSKRISRSAQNWQEIQTAVTFPDLPLRALLTSYQFGAAEQANQIASRADALLQQIDGLDRRELPLSAFIAGSAPTDFARLFEWNDAYLYSFTKNHWFGDNVEDRVKILERLQADLNWARVNTVYASGRGDTSMAFIKDDIGNWSLKQFDNAPGELLKAYTDVTKAALSTAADLATKIGSGGSTAGIKQLVGLADALSFGDSSTPGTARAPIDLQPARTRLQARLDEIARLAAEQEALLKNGTPDQKKALRVSVESEIRTALTAYQSTLDLLDDATQPAGSLSGGGLSGGSLSGAISGALPGGVSVPGGASIPGNLPGIGGTPQIPGR